MPSAGALASSAGPALPCWLLCLWSASRGGLLAGAVEYSVACPAVEARSLSVCDRCVHDDLCPVVGGVSYRCDHYFKKCVSPAWNSSEIGGQCPETYSEPATWGAMCKLPCPDQQSPYGCASNNCLNEDFPCHWVPGCSSQEDWVPFGLPLLSSACLRSCTDHEPFVRALYDVESCDRLKSAWGGCSVNAMYQLCPVMCESPECNDRCGREEAPDEGGMKCYQHVEINGVDCIDAIKMGLDCHCKCGNVYLAVSGTPYRKGGGAFTWRDRTQGRKLDFEIDVTVEKKFSISLAGESMSPEQGVYNPARLKIVEKNAPCTHANNAEGVEGLLCERAPGSDLLAIAVCDTFPNVATKWLHRWKELSVGHCGDFDICHCNAECNVRESWKLAGTVRVRPPDSLTGDVSKAPPGCDAYLPTSAPVEQIQGEEAPKEGLVKVSLSIAGGLKEIFELATVEVLTAIQQALAEYLESNSELLGKKVPELGDVALEAVTSRRLRRLRPSAGAGAGGRRAQAACADDDAKFLEEATALGAPLATCAEGVSMAGSVEALCNDAALEVAVAFCPVTCGTCGGGSGTSAPSGGSEGEDEGEGGGDGDEDPGAVSTTAAPSTTAPWPGGPEALRLRVEVKTHTDKNADVVLARLEHLKTDTVQFVQLLFSYLELAGFSTATLPQALSVFVHEGPVLTGVGDSAFEEEADQQGSSSFLTSAVFLIVGSTVGGSCVLACCAAALYLFCNSSSSYETKVQPTERPDRQREVRETTTRSEGGYRFKKQQEEYEVETGQEWQDWQPAPKKAKPKKPSGPGCCSRILARCCAPRLRRPDLPPTVAAGPAARPGGGLEIGDTVQLCGLSAMPHYNGLYGTVASGLNENGRYSVDIVVAEDEHARELQTKAFRAENLRLYGPSAAAAAASAASAAAAQPGAARGGGADGGSWRNGRR